MEIPLEVKQFIAGFIDGDGCITLIQPRDDRNKPCPIVMVNQAKDSSVPEELEYVQKFYGGTITESQRVVKRRRYWQLNIRRQEDVVKILLDLKKHCVIKNRQAEAALDYLLEGRDRHKYYAEKLLGLKKAYSSIVPDASRFCAPYLAGIFAAEGSVGLYQRKDRPNGNGLKLTALLPQHCCPAFIHAVKNHLGYGSVVSERVGKTALHLSALQCRQFFALISPFLIGQKAPQVKLALEIQAKVPPSGGFKRSSSHQFDAKEIEEKMKKMKKE